MSYTPRSYEQIVRDLLTTLTGGTVRETLVAPDGGDTVALPQLRNRPVRRVSHLEGTTTIGTGPAATQAPYRFTAADFELVSTTGNENDKDAIRFRESGRRPTPGTVLTVNYYPVQTAPVPLTDLNVGSVVRTLVETIARELAVTYLHLEHVYESAFVDTADGDSLDKVVALIGVSRLPAGFPVVKVRFSRGTGAPGRITVPAGTPVLDGDGNRYLTVTSITLEPGETTRDVQARGETPGTPLVQQGKLDRLEVTIAGISEVTNPEPARALSAPETDDELRRRAPGALHGVVRGTVDALRFGLLSIEGVKDVAVTEAPNGVPGEIRLEIAYVNEGDADVANRVQQAVDELRPAGIRIEHRGAARRKVNLRIELTLAGAGVTGAELDALEAGVEDRVGRFLDAVAPGGTVRRAQLTALVLQDPAIVDAKVVLVEGTAENEELTLKPGEVLDVARPFVFAAPKSEKAAAPQPTTARVSAILPVHLAPGVTEAAASDAITRALDTYLRSRRPDAALDVDGIAAAIRDDSRYALIRNEVQVTVESNGTFLQLADHVGAYAPPENQQLRKGTVNVDAREAVS